MVIEQHDIRKFWTIGVGGRIMISRVKEIDMQFEDTIRTSMLNEMDHNDITLEDIRKALDLWTMTDYDVVEVDDLFELYKVQ